MLEEVLTHLNLDPATDVVDATVGLGGHAAAILERIPEGKLLGLDRDPDSLKQAEKHLARFGRRVTLKPEDYGNLAAVLRKLPGGFDPGAILMDLGLSSWQLAERGFSFAAEAPLDLRFGRTGPTAADLVSSLPEAELADLIYRFGEERASRKIAKAIVTRRRQRPIRTTTDLADIIAEAKPRRGRIHPATQTFQALRIAVNDELGSLERGLSASEGALITGGRLAVISFHSLEDRLVKQYLKQSTRLDVVNKKVIQPTRAETLRNPRARSAKLRIAEKA
jgi:16S rRNA (cytosine1402-N4)-methyltransferase